MVTLRPRRWLMATLQPFISLGTASRRMALALFLWGMGEGLWMFVRPLYVTELGGNPAQAGQVLAMAGLAPVLLMLPAGRLVDRVGPRGLLLSTWWIGTLAAVVLAVAPGWQWLFPGFFLYAMSAASIPAIDSYIARDAHHNRPGETLHTREVQAMIAVVFAAYFAGTVFSPIIGGWLGQAFGLRTVFWVSAGWFFLSALAVHSTPTLPEYHQRGQAEPGGRVPSAWWRLSRGQVRVYATLLALFFFVALGYALVPSFVEDVRGLPVSAIGSLGTATALGGMVWMLALGGYHSRAALAAAAGLMALAFAGLLLIPAGPAVLPGLIIVYFLLGVYMAIRTLALGVASEYAPPEQHGTAFALVETMFGVGAFLGPWIAGLLYVNAPAMPFLVAVAALVPLVGIAWLALRPPRAG